MGKISNKHLLYFAEGRQLATEKDNERKLEAKKQSDGAQRRREKENSREENRWKWGPNTTFTGLLSSKLKDDLMDIAWSLQLSEEGMKAQLLDCINVYFDTHAAERESQKYCGLFARALRGRHAAASVAADDLPQASTSQIPPSSTLQNLPIPNGYPDHDNLNYPFTFAAPPILPQYPQNPPLFQRPFAAPDMSYDMAFPNTLLEPFNTHFNTYSDFENPF
ncbi:hypothetical protein DFH07DRAFT_1032319 [Mycena maculata]|uniref:Uncharacterized protein n=1 Tax=Mycena maculata TaxID=230809 RepID=A0AAD7IW49_9AGAR|nr:hypothetical protein DFH07DRAFT_1032319 [Mycena maculata]